MSHKIKILGHFLKGSKNTATGYGGGIFLLWESNPILTNSIIWDNNLESIHSNNYGNSQPIVTYSNIEDGWEGAGNIDIDALFTDSENGDYNLQEGSPCINRGTSDLDGDGIEDISDYDGNAPDMGAYEIICESGIYDECGVCNGPGAIFTCGCYDLQEFYDCDGNCLNDIDDDLVCDELEIIGCTDPIALNYNEEASDDGSCIYPINNDIWISPIGDNSLNTGLSEDSPFKTIEYALWRLTSDTLNINTIYLMEGIYSPSTNGENFPVIMKRNVNIVGSGEEVTILDANQTGRVITMEYCVNNAITNLTITGGLAEGDVYQDDFGGGMSLYLSN